MTFDAAGGTVGQATKVVNFGKEYGELPTPVRTGYSFAGWKLSDEVIVANTVVAALDDHTLTAQWTVNQYLVTFEANYINENGGMAGVDMLFDYGNEIEAPIFTRTGYTFVGWSPELPATVPAENVTYTAQWTINKYSVVFDANGGEGGKRESLDYGSAISAPTVTRRGWTFAGWSPEVATTLPAEDVTYTAQWEVIETPCSYTAENGEITITGLAKGYEGELAIPSYIGDYPVKSIGESAFEECVGLTNVTIPDTVTSIGDYAFYRCSGLTSVTIPDSVTSVGEYAFCWCSGLANVSLGNGVRSIGEGAFAGCGGLQAFAVGVGNSSYKSVDGMLLSKGGKTLYCGINGDVTIPSGVTSIAGYAFYGFNGLTSLTIPKGVSRIDDFAFANCDSLGRITILGTVANVGEFAFDGSCVGEATLPGWNCGLYLGSATNIVISAGTTTIRAEAFAWCGSLANVTIPDSVTSIGASAFQGCCLPSVTIPDSVTSIGEYAFAWNNLLKSVTMGNSVTNIGQYAFQDCSGLTSLTLPDCGTTLWGYAFQGCSGLTSVTIPDGVDDREMTAFYGCNNIREVTISGIGLGPYSIRTENVTNVVVCAGTASIGDFAFEYCSGLTSVTIPDSVKSIGEYAFEHCSGLTSVTIPDSVTSIGDFAFEYCSGLTNVTIPNSVASIGVLAFGGCGNLEDVTIPASVKSIGQYAFDGCNVESVTIGSGGVTRLGTGAFYDCSLGTVTIESGAKWITSGYGYDDYGVFEYCSVASLTIRGAINTPFYLSDVTRLTIWDGASGLDQAFDSCYVYGVTIERDVISLEEWAFYGCICLGPFDVAEGNACYASVDGLLLSKDGKSLVKGIGGNVSIPDSVTSIGDCAFAGREDLDDVTIPNSVTNIGNYAFYDCIYLTSVTVPFKVASIGSEAFHCSGGGNEMYYSLREIFIPNTCSVASDAIPKSVNIVYYKPTQDVSLDVADGTANPATISVNYGTTYGELPVPDRVGYSFDCWMLEGVVVEAGTIVTTLDDHTLTAQWTPNKYTVTFDANGGEGGTSEVLDCGKAIVAPTVTREGYTFTGWDSEVAATVPAGDVTYTAQWEINQYTVTFNANGGEGGTSGKQDYGTAIAAPTVTREGYTFKGWDREVAATVPAGDVTYTAQWEVNQYTVTFNANGGVGGRSVTQDYGTKLSAPVVTRTGYTFAGWSPEVAAKVPASNVTYTAQWTANQYTVTFDANGGEVGTATKTVMFDNAFGELPEPTRMHYEFAGWFTAKEDGESVDAGTIFNTDGNVTLYARWRCIWLYGVNDEEVEITGTIYGAEYSGEPSIPSMIEGMPVTGIADGAFSGCTELSRIEIPESVEHIGGGVVCEIRGEWAKTESGQQVGGSVYRSAEIGRNGETSMSMEVYVGEATDWSFDWWVLSESGYDFLSWRLDGVEKSQISGDAAGTVELSIPAGRHTIEWSYAKDASGDIGDDCGWVRIGRVSGSSGVFAGCVALEEIVFNGDCPTVGEGAFDGIGANCRAVVPNDCASWDEYIPGTWHGISIDCVVPVVKFDVNGGDADVAIYQTCDGVVGADLPVAERVGYLFCGWWTDANGGEKVEEGAILSGSIVAYAHWDANTYTVTFNANGGEVGETERSVEYGSAIGELPVPTIADGEFIGWFTEQEGGEKVCAQTTFADADNRTIYAHWRMGTTPMVSNVSAKQRFSENGKVDISFDVAGEFDVPVELYITANDAVTGEAWTAFEIGELSGDTNSLAGTHSVVWDMGENGSKRLSPDTVFTVSYTKMPAPYIAIDLSGGTLAVSYAVTELYDSDIPKEGWTDTYKTDKLIMRRIREVTSGGVLLKNAYYIGVFEVTQRQWELVVGSNPSFHTNISKSAIYPVEMVSYNMIRGVPVRGKQYDWPITTNEVDEASFMGILRAKTDIDEFDLPTEAQWEYACRAGTTTEYYTGNDTIALDKAGWYQDNTGSTQPVGTKDPNTWGLYDMHGNVWEWCLDRYDDSKAQRVMRGGGWQSPYDRCYSYYRGLDHTKNVTNRNGFRLARTMSYVAPIALASASAAIDRSMYDWALQYPKFAETFLNNGENILSVFSKPTGKRDGAGKPMSVWHDFVVGTDPTKEEDVFKVDIDFDEDGNPIISWTPELTEEEAAKRVYKKLGKMRLDDPKWSEIEDNEADYNFFKVEVEMR